MKLLTIIYVANQAASRNFYAKTLGVEPYLDVPGMTEFEFGQGKLGIMPEAGIKRLLGEQLPDPSKANGIPRCELYFTVEDAAAYHARALQAGAKELSPLQMRNWGDLAAYSLDLDGHIVTFAQNTP